MSPSSSTQPTSPTNMPPPPSPSQERPHHYTLFLRLPFPRPATFTDPPPIDWDTTKDRQLWKLISSSSGGAKDLNWEVLSQRFEVPLGFLLQQTAWLYERHFEGVRRGLGRLGVGDAGGGEEGEAGKGGVAMERGGSRDSQKQSTITTKRLQSTEELKPPPSPRSKNLAISRTPSSATVTQSRIFPTNTSTSRRNSQTQSRKPLPASKQADDIEASQGHDDDLESDSEDEPSRRQPYRRSALSRRPPAMGTLSSDGDAEDDEEGESSGGFLPFAAIQAEELAQRSAATTASKLAKPSSSRSTPRQPPPISSSASSNNSSQPQSTHPPTTKPTPPPPTADLSPRQPPRSNLSPRYRHIVSGSEGSPSMGSSFSELEDLSVTQSALEDALLSHVGHGGSINLGLGSLVREGREGG